MSKSSKVGVVLAAAVGTAFLTMAGCASQGSGAATPATVPNSCGNVVTQNACKNKAGCKNQASPSHHKKHHVTSSTEVKSDATTTTATTETATEAK